MDYDDDDDDGVNVLMIVILKKKDDVVMMMMLMMNQLFQKFQFRGAPGEGFQGGVDVRVLVGLEHRRVGEAWWWVESRTNVTSTLISVTLVMMMMTMMMMVERQKCNLKI